MVTAIRNKSIFFTAPKYRKTLSFDGVDDYADIGLNKLGPLLNLAAGVTLEAWIRPSSQGSGVILSQIVDLTYQGIRMLMAGGFLQIIAKVKDDGVDFTATDTTRKFNKGEIVHVVGVADIAGDLLIGYVNGAQVFSTATAFISTSYTHGIPSVGSNDTIGAYDFGTSYSTLFPGTIDEVRVWKVARTQAQIQGNMRRKLVGNEANLVFYARCDEGIGTTLDDLTSNNNNATITGASWSRRKTQ